MKKPNEDVARFVPAFQRGTAYGYDKAGKKVLTVTALEVKTDDPFYQELLRIDPPGGPFVGENLPDWAERAAERAWIRVTRWEFEGRPTGPDPVEEGKIY